MTDRQLLHKYLSGQSTEFIERIGRETLLEIVQVVARRREGLDESNKTTVTTAAPGELRDNMYNVSPQDVSSVSGESGKSPSTCKCEGEQDVSKQQETVEAGMQWENELKSELMNSLRVFDLDPEVANKYWKTSWFINFKKAVDKYAARKVAQAIQRQAEEDDNHNWKLSPDQSDTGAVGVRKYCSVGREEQTFYDPTLRRLLDNRKGKK